MKSKIISIKYLNPWYDSTNKQSQKLYYRSNVKCWSSKCGKGKILEIMPYNIHGSDVEYKNSYVWYDYLINNCVVIQRTVNSLEELEKYIKLLLNNGKYFLGADRIKKVYELGIKYENNL